MVRVVGTSLPRVHHLQLLLHQSTASSNLPVTGSRLLSLNVATTIKAFGRSTDPHISQRGYAYGITSISVLLGLPRVHPFLENDHDYRNVILVG